MRDDSFETKVKAAIEEIPVPQKEKQEILAKLYEKRNSKNLRRWRSGLVPVLIVVFVLGLGANWYQIQTIAGDLWKQITLVEWKDTEEKTSEKEEFQEIGKGMLETKSYAVPESMETFPCITKWYKVKQEHFWIKEYTGRYHFQRKDYKLLENASKELGVPVLWLDREERKTQLTICEEAVSKPAILVTEYARENGKEFCVYLRATMYGGDLSGYDLEGKLDMGEDFITSYPVGNGLTAYIYYNQYNKSDYETFLCYNKVQEKEKIVEVEDWKSEAGIFAPADSYEAILFHDGIRYEITGAKSEEEIKDILEDLQED